MIYDARRVDAASATANGLPLVTLNRRHFEPLTLHGLRLL